MTEITSLRVAVFGVSRSGKDYNIGKVRETMNGLGLKFVHYPCIPTIRDYSSLMLGREFEQTTAEEKEHLMDIFRKKISDRKNIPYLIQDEHCCFPVTHGGKPLINDYTKAKMPFELMNGHDGRREYEVVLKEEWIAECDMIFYLCPSPDVVRDRMRNSDSKKRNAQITSEDVDLWMEFEIGLLEEVCARKKLYFEVLRGNEGAHDRIVNRICGMAGHSY